MASLPPGIDLSTIPLTLPPPGIISNFVDPESLENKVILVGILMLVLTALVVIVRLFSNYRATRGLGWDDCSCVIATLLFLIYVVLSLELRDLARHTYDLPITRITSSNLKRIFVSGMTSPATTFFAKLSLCMLYYRLFKIQKAIRYAIIFGITFSFIFYFSNMLVSAIACAPKVGHPWDLTFVAKCARLTAVFDFILGIINSLLDVFLLILPIPVILQLQLSVKKKIGLLAVFMVGSFALVASIISLVYRIKFWQGTDPNWNGYICSMWIIIETGVTIMCSSTSALVTFWKVYIRVYVTPICSHLCSRYSELAIRFKFVSETSSNTQMCPPGSDQSRSSRSLYNRNYVELDEHQKLNGLPDSVVKTEIGGGSLPSDVEKGVIRKSMKVEQSFN